MSVQPQEPPLQPMRVNLQTVSKTSRFSLDGGATLIDAALFVLRNFCFARLIMPSSRQDSGFQPQTRKFLWWSEKCAISAVRFLDKEAEPASSRERHGKEKGGRQVTGGMRTNADERDLAWAGGRGTRTWPPSRTWTWPPSRTWTWQGEARRGGLHVGRGRLRCCAAG